MKFKTDRIEQEFKQLSIKNPDLARIINWIGITAFTMFGKEIVLTDIFRTILEQVKIYGVGTKKVSPHMLWHAVDLRSSTFTDDEIKQLVDLINNTYNKNNVYKFTAMCHEVNGFGMHFHIQYCKK